MAGKYMKKNIVALLAIIGLAWVPAGAIAQEDPGCFMVDTDGNAIDLGPLCPGGGEDSLTLPSNPGFFQASIKRRLGGVPVVDVVFNGSESFEMLLDTGASVTLITPGMAQALNLETSREVETTVASGDSITVGVAKVRSIQTGNLIVGQSEVAIAPEKAEEGLGGMGLLGQNFFGNYDVTIKENHVEFRKRS